MKKRLFSFLFVLISSPSLAIKKSVECRSVNFFDQTWPQLVKRDRTLQNLIDKMASLSPERPEGGLDTTNCNVEWEETDQGIPTNSYRGIIADRVWSTDGGRSLYQAGFKVRYWVTAGAPKLGNETVGDISGLAFCGDIDACKYMGIPFAAAPNGLPLPQVGLSNP